MRSLRFVFSTAPIAFIFALAFTRALGTPLPDLVTITPNSNNLFLNGALSFNSSSFGGSFGPAQAFDNTLNGNPPDHVDSGLIFSGPPNEFMAVTGFTPASFSQLWLYTRASDNGRTPNTVHIWSSTSSTTSLLSSAYQTDLGSFTLGMSAFPNSASLVTGFTDATYAILNVSAPSGTTSFLFDFSSLSGVRISEIQGFGAVTPVPEPATYATIAGLLIGGAAIFRRQRKNRNAT